jgi:hypothetical protein
MILSAALLLYYLVKVACHIACHFLVNQGVSVLTRNKTKKELNEHHNHNSIKESTRNKSV